MNRLIEGEDRRQAALLPDLFSRWIASKPDVTGDDGEMLTDALLMSVWRGQGSNLVEPCNGFW